MTPDQFLGRYLNGKCFYHFTDTRNIPKIRETGGIYALSELTRRSISIPAAGGNQLSHQLDTRRGLDNYVHLCLFDEHPMEYVARQEGRIIESRFLQISPEVIKLEGIRFSPDVSNKNNVPILMLDEACAMMDFEVVYDRTDWKSQEIQERRKNAKKYELLIPSTVSSNLIMGW